MQVSVLQDIVIVFKLMLVALQMLAALFWQSDDFFTENIRRNIKCKSESNWLMELW